MNEYLGYTHPDYANSLSEFGRPRELPSSGGWILERQISDTPYNDAMGCYPLFTCRDWSHIYEDLEKVGCDIVTLAVVIDPFAEVSAEELKKCFDIVKPFKTHYVANLEQPLEEIVRKTSRADARKALGVMDVEICLEPARYHSEWARLYDNLICRHDIKGVNAFSAKSFETQLEIPGMIMVLGRQAGELVGAVLFLVQGNVCYGHLAAFTPAGYKIKAFSGILWRAMEYLQKQGVRLLDHGGHAGTQEDPKDGLVIFKRGWSNETRQVFFCGRIFDRQKYEIICKQKHIQDTEYFPAYRVGEFHSTEINSDIEINRTDEITGYMHPDYANSLSEFGRPRELPLCGGWILERRISDTPYSDALGCYPLFLCRDWSRLHEDLEGLGDELVSLLLVTDPFGNYDQAYLSKCFKDVVVPFKEHFITDVSQPIDSIVSKSHQSTVRRAMRNVEVQRCPEPVLFVDEWVELFANLVKRHGITGIRAFSPKAFAKQLSIPGMIMFRAVSQGVTLGLDLWYVHGEVAHGHLVAISPLGYELRASYALKWHLIQYFADKVHWLDLGGGAGIKSDSGDGLSDFKRGWSTGTRMAYLCGRIFDSGKYASICQQWNITHTEYFPAYRKGEFG